MKALSLCFIVLASSLGVAGDGPGRTTLSKVDTAQLAYETTVTEARRALLAELDRVDPTNSSAEDVERRKADRAAFEQRGALPASVAAAARTYAKTIAGAEKRLLAALELAESGQRNASRHTEADQLAKRAEEAARRLDAAQWTDLRCEEGLELKGGAHWFGPTIAFDGTDEASILLPLPRLERRAGYRVRLEVERVSGVGELQFTLPRVDVEPRTRAVLVLAGFGGAQSGLELVDGAPASENPTSVERGVFAEGRTARIELECTSNAIVVSVDDRTLIEWTELTRLTLPSGLAREAKGDGRHLRLRSPKGTSLRLDSAFALTLPASKVEARPNTPEASVVEVDRLALGRTFVGTWTNEDGRDERWCKVEVIERDRASKRVELRVTGEKQAAWRVSAKTSDDGSKLELTDVRMVKPAPTERMFTVDFGSGRGRISDSGTLSINWFAKTDGSTWKNKSWDRRIEVAAE